MTSSVQTYMHTVLPRLRMPSEEKQFLLNKLLFFFLMQVALKKSTKRSIMQYSKVSKLK